MWEGHLGSKAHRVNVIKMREDEARRQQEEEEAARRRSMGITTGKRKADEDDEMEDFEEPKRARLSEEDEDSQPPIPATNLQPNGGGFPADFFSDPSRALPIDADEDEGQVPENAPPKSKTEIDLEFEKFQAEILTKMNTSVDDAEPDEERRESYQRATVFAEAELVQAADGFPGRLGQGEAVEEEPEQKEETEEEKRKRKEQEDRELIMDRLLEEERAQEEADARVGLLKARVEALKLAREAKKSAGKKKAS